MPSAAALLDDLFEADGCDRTARQGRIDPLIDALATMAQRLDSGAALPTARLGPAATKR